MSKEDGKKFEESLDQSAKNQNIFCFRVRDVNPMAFKKGNWSIPKNKFDFLFYHKGFLFPMELKSTKQKSISFSEKIIKEYQIKSLTDATSYKGVIPGFIFNFREPDNRTFFIHISNFNKYKNIAENNLKHDYTSRVNESSIPVGICEEIGIEIKHYKPRSRYTYYLNKLFDELIENHNGGD
ncbi:hypothetical protein [Paraliobacillus ryukyuensis]|uniref:hypothetical protein n=1 Tax=Paraliobacillus ryukyuensis TaxID=200904 RepID=UPI0009A6CF22|nr:hypothetical protein [Paraliobacillus ryukyuensis]